MADHGTSSSDSEQKLSKSEMALASQKMLTSPEMVAEIMNRPLPAFVQGRAPKQEPVQGLTYAKTWNTVDFLGKYHIANFKNKANPTPGTAIYQEMKHMKNKADDVERFEAALAQRASKCRLRLTVRTENALFQTQISIGTQIGRPIEEAQEVLRKKDQEVDQQQNPRFPDTKKEIDRFMKNVLSGNANYVLFAATLGYKSFDYQDPETGNSALHFAVKAGHVEMVEELLKYTADPNLRNRLGDTAILDCWYFWGTKKFNRTKEEREAQERKTHRMILSILQYGGFVDSVNQRGETALHVACRMGTTKIVLTLLGFRANHTVLTKAGKSAAEVAEENGRHEVAKMFAIWDAIRHRFVHVDFLVLWRAFLKDFEAVITPEKSSESILIDLNMEMNVAKVEREVQAREKGGVTIDDVLLRQTYTKMRNADAAAPKPWEPTWEAFVAECHAKGIFSPHADLIQIDPRAPRKKTGKGVAVDSDAGLSRAALANKKLPDRDMPEPRPRTREATLRSLSRGRSRLFSIRQRSNSMSGDSVGSGSRSPSRSRSPSILNAAAAAASAASAASTGGGGTFPIASMTSPVARPSSGNSFTTAGGRGSGSSGGVRPSSTNIQLPRITLDSIPSDQPFSPLENFSTSLASSVSDNSFTASDEKQRPRSAVHERRMISAHRVALDAKFYRFTKRPATSSALFLSLRTATAPLEGTEEQSSIMRHVTSQGKEYELVSKNKKLDLRARLGFKVKEPPKSRLGDYTEGIEVEMSAERDQLYARLNVKPMSDVEAIEQAMLAAAEERKKNKGAREAVIQAKVDMINDRRLRFVESVVLPPARKLTMVERAAKEKEAAEEAERKRKLGLAGEAGEAAKAELMQTLLAPVKEGDDGTSESNSVYLGNDVIEAGNHRRKANAKRLKKIRGLQLLQTKEVKYGAGRLRSSHNLTGKIEAPWSLTSGRFVVQEGDRTG